MKNLDADSKLIIAIGELSYSWYELEMGGCGISVPHFETVEIL